MKKLLYLFLAIALSTAMANAQDSAQNGKVALKNGSVIEGTIQKQGNDVIVTTTAGDVFYFSQDEISRIQTEDTTSGNTSSVFRPTGKAGFMTYKKEAKAAYREARVFGGDVSQFWGGNEQAQHYYEKYKRLNTAAWITAATGGALIGVVGPVLLSAYDSEPYTKYTDEWGNEISYDEGYFIGSVASFAIGGACLLTACILPIVAQSNLKRSYQYYDRYGKNHSLNISATPVIYAQGGAGIGISLRF